MVLQLVKKIPRIFGTRKFITVLTNARHLSLSWANSIQSPQPHPTSWRSILILSSYLRLGLPNGLFPSGFPTRTLCTPLPSPICATYIACKKCFKMLLHKIQASALHLQLTVCVFLQYCHLLLRWCLPADINQPNVPHYEGRSTVCNCVNYGEENPLSRISNKSEEFRIKDPIPVLTTLADNVGKATFHLQYSGTLRSCFTPVCFMSYCCNAPYQFTPLPNKCPLIFILMLFGWFIDILGLLSDENIIFDFRLFDLGPLF